MNLGTKFLYNFCHFEEEKKFRTIDLTKLGRFFYETNIIPKVKCFCAKVWCTMYSNHTPGSVNIINKHSYIHPAKYARSGLI